MDKKHEPRPSIIVRIDEKEYKATAFLSMRDMEYIEGVNFSAADLNYDEILRVIIHHHLTDYPNDSIGADTIDATEIHRFIELYISSSDELKRDFELIGEEDENKRFVECIHSRTTTLGEQLSENLQPVLQSITNSISIDTSLMPHYEINPTFLDSMNEYARASSSYMSLALKEMAQKLNDLIQCMMPTYTNMMQGLSQTLAQIVESFRSSMLSDERKEKLQESFAKWGSYGWTLPPKADFKLFFTAPVDRHDVYKMISPYINKASMVDLFDILKSMKNIRKSDLKEAIADYEDRRYKSCIMILFALLDSRIIRLQDNNKWRQLGYKGADEYFKELDANEMVELSFSDILYKFGILSTLNVVFEGGENFVDQPKQINRNFVDHGMLHRNVNQKDCKKIFLLLYNFTSLVNDIADDRK